ncbi:MAG: hypothetical protein ACI8WM_001431 [Burkholderiaceae bacterium]|jgi:hypothetical protein
MSRLIVRASGLMAIVLMTISAGLAHAGRPCETKTLTADIIVRAMALAATTATRLDESGASVVVIARKGQDLSKYGVRYSHLGFAYKTSDGKWRVVHKLNECATANAAVYRQGLGEFFLDDLWRMEAGVAMLTPAVQAKLLPALSDNAKLAQVNTPAYSMVAYPWSQRYQQSNQWAIETMAMTQDPDAFDRPHAQAWLQLKGYAPTTLHLSLMQRFGARVMSANVAFDDHPDAKRFSGQIQTVTADSVFTWLERSGLGTNVRTIR